MIERVVSITISGAIFLLALIVYDNAYGHVTGAHFLISLLTILCLVAFVAWFERRRERHLSVAAEPLPPSTSRRVTPRKRKRKKRR